MGNIPFWDNVTTGYSSITPQSEWDYIIIGGLIVPGTAEVQAKAKYKVDASSSPGKKGGKTRNTGYQPTDVEIKIHIWDPVQWENFQPFLATLWPSKKVAAQPASTPNPSTSDVAAANVVIAQSASTSVDPKKLAAAKKTVAQAKTARQPAATVNPISISHPALTILGISSIQIIGMSTPTNGAYQEKVYTISAREFVPPTSVAVSNPDRADISVTVTNPQLNGKIANPPTANGVKPKPSSTNAGPL